MENNKIICFKQREENLICQTSGNKENIAKIKLKMINILQHSINYSSIYINCNPDSVTRVFGNAMVNETVMNTEKMDSLKS